MLPLRPNPTPPITNAGPVLLENPISRSHSSFEINPPLYKSTPTFTPSGKPHINPTAYAVIAYPFILNILSKSKRIHFIKSNLAKPTITSVKIIKGKTEPIIVFAHSFSPSRVYFVIYGDKNTEINAEKAKINKEPRIFLFFPALSFFCRWDKSVIFIISLP